MTQSEMGDCSRTQDRRLLRQPGRGACPALSNPMGCTAAGFPVLHRLRSLRKLSAR